MQLEQKTVRKKQESIKTITLKNVFGFIKTTKWFQSCFEWETGNSLSRSPVKGFTVI